MRTTPSTGLAACGTASAHGVVAAAATDEQSPTPVYTRHNARLLSEKLRGSSIRLQATVERLKASRSSSRFETWLRG